MDGDLPFPPPESPFILLGQSNLDPRDGQGRRAAMQALLSHKALQDAEPRGTSGRSDPGQTGDPALDTALYDGIGGLRVEVILPSASLNVSAAGMLSPPDGDQMAATLTTASRHWPIWVEITQP